MNRIKQDKSLWLTPIKITGYILDILFIPVNTVLFVLL